MRGNSFDGMRIIAAIVVVVSHALELTAGRASADPIYCYSHGQTSLGGLAVAAFFIMSGYLITGSWQRRQTWSAFLKARVTRIYPALFMALLVPAISSGFMSGQWITAAIYVSDGLALQPQYHLSGLFENNPSYVVNGSLWTLCWEAVCYIGILIFGQIRLLNHRTILIALAAILMAAEFIDKPYLPLLAFFLSGSAGYLWRDTLRWTPSRVLAGGIIVFLAFPTPLLVPAIALAGGYGLLYLCRCSHLVKWGRFGDPSYGIYVYAFPIQQTLIAFGLTSWLLNAVATLIVVIPLGLLSWWLIERPALNRPAMTTSIS